LRGVNEAGEWKLGIGNAKMETRNLKLQNANWDWKKEIGNWKLGNGNWRFETGKRKLELENGDWELETGRPKLDGCGCTVLKPGISNLKFPFGESATRNGTA
jgi:hypothetical protein